MWLDCRITAEGHFNATLVGTAERSLDEIAALTTIDHKLAHHQKKRAALNDLFQTLLHKLMTGAIRVADIDIDTSEITAPPGAPS